MESVPVSVVKLIKSLQLKKYRQKEQLFLVEGEKSIQELSNSDFKVRFLVGTKEFLNSLHGKLEGAQQFATTEGKLASYGTLKSNNAGIAVVEIPETNSVPPQQEISLVLDSINDPGNLGTIIRIADWYGLSHVVASSTTTDCFNPKVVNSTKGSFTRVKVFYQDLSDHLTSREGAILGADMGGESIHQFQYKGQVTLVIGSESHGISKEVKKHLTGSVAIPGAGRAESLNAAVSTGILLDNLVRRNG